MQLSTSTVPSESNALAGIFPVGASIVAAEGPGLAEPAGFAELMAALAPASAVVSPAIATPAQTSGASVKSVAAPTSVATLVGCGSAIADLRAPGVTAQVEDDTGTECAVVQDDLPVTTEPEFEAPATRTGAPCEEDRPLELPRVRELRRNPHEPVVGLETMIVPQLTAAPALVVGAELDEEPAELDTEEAPLEEDGPGYEESTEELAPFAAGDVAQMPSPAFEEITPQTAVVQPSLTRRQASAPALSPVTQLTPQVTPPETASGDGNVAASASPFIGSLHRDATAGQGTVTPFAALDLRAAAMAFTAPTPIISAPMAATPTAPVIARAELPRMETAASEMAPAVSALLDPMSLSQSVASETSARIAVEVQPVRPARAFMVEPSVARAVAAREGEAEAPGNPSGTAAVPAEAIAVAPTTQHEVAPRIAAPRVSAAYSTREKFAAERPGLLSERAAPDHPGKLTSLDADDESLKQVSGGIGIDVAKPATVMPAPSSPITFATIVPQAVSVQEVASSPAQGTADVRVPEAVSSAEQAVEVVLRAVDTAADREQKIVKLEFSVGDADLSVRVELADNEVRTTFRTESHELRAALAHEWQAVSADSAEQGGVRLAAAVISDKEPSTSTSPDANPQRQERHTARQEEAAASAHQAAARSLLRATAAADVPASAATASRAPAPAGTAQRLHLFA